MIFMRAFFRGIVLFVVLVSAGLWVVAATLQSTLLNRDTVKQWGTESGAYGNVMETLEIRQLDETGSVDGALLREAINQTLTLGYVQEQSEVAVDAFYDWVDGTSSEVTYTIPIQERRDEFIDNLAGKLEEKVRSLPQCTGSFSLQQECIPRTYTPETYAASIAKQTADDSDLFVEPIVVEAVEPVGVVATLPMLAYWSGVASWVLPILAVLMGGAYVALSQKWRNGIANLGKRLVFSSVFLVIIGAITWIFGGSLDLATRLFGGSDMSFVSSVIEPILHQAIPTIGMWLTIWSGSVLILGVLLWIVGFILGRQTKMNTSVSTSAPSPETPPIQPSQPQENRPQSNVSISRPPLSAPVVQPPTVRQSPEALPTVPAPRSATGRVNSAPRPQPSSQSPRRPIDF